MCVCSCARFVCGGGYTSIPLEPPLPYSFTYACRGKDGAGEPGLMPPVLIDIILCGAY